MSIAHTTKEFMLFAPSESNYVGSCPGEKSSAVVWKLKERRVEWGSNGRHIHPFQDSPVPVLSNAVVKMMTFVFFFLFGFWSLAWAWAVLGLGFVLGSCWAWFRSDWVRDYTNV